MKSSSWPLLWAAHMAGVAVVVMVLIWCIYFRGGLSFTDKSLFFNVHPVFMLIGFVFFSGEAILVYRVVPGSHEKRKIVHTLAHLKVLVTGICGVSFAFGSHQMFSLGNLYSLHSWLGLAAISLYFIQLLVGVYAFLYPAASTTAKEKFLPWHALLGLIIFVLSIVTTELGLFERLTYLQSIGLDKFGSEAILVNSTAIVVVFFGFFVVLSTIIPQTGHHQRVKIREINGHLENGVVNGASHDSHNTKLMTPNL